LHPQGLPSPRVLEVGENGSLLGEARALAFGVGALSALAGAYFDLYWPVVPRPRGFPRAFGTPKSSPDDDSCEKQETP
jgi:hypothetical protein